MSYSTEITADNSAKRTLVKIAPRRRVTGWALYSGSVYSRAFAFGPVTGLAVNGTALVSGSSVSLSAGQFYHDLDAGVLYVRKSDSSAPGSDWLVATFEIFFATEEIVWYRNPLDSSSASVRWQGSIGKEVPSLNHSTKLAAFGFTPADSTQLSVKYDPEYLQELLYDSAFKSARVDVYHVVGDLSVANSSSLMAGVIGKVSVTDSDLKFEILDRVAGFEKQVTLGDGNTLFVGSNFTSADPNDENSPIPLAVGSMIGTEGFIRALPIRYVPGSSSTSDNRDYVVCTRAGSVGPGTLAVAVVDYSTNHETIISASDASKFPIGARIATIFDAGPSAGSFNWGTIVDKSISAGKCHLIVERADGTNGGGGPASGADTVNAYIPFVVVELIKNWQDPANSVSCPLFYQKHFHVEYFAQNTIGIRLFSTVEADFTIGTIDPATDAVFVQIAGNVVPPTIGGLGFGSYSSDYGFFANAVLVLYDFLKTFCGLEESDIDTASFQALVSEVTTEIGVVFPKNGEGSLPTCAEVINTILSTALLKAFFNSDGKFSIARTKSPGSSSQSFTDEEIKKSSFVYEFAHEEISTIRTQYPIEYRTGRLITDAVGATGTVAAKEDVAIADPIVKESLIQSDAAKYLHKTTRQNDVAAYACINSRSTFESKMKELLGDRSGRLALSLPISAIQRSMNDIVTVSRTRLPGFAFDEDTSRSRDFAIVEISRGKDQVTVTLDDQKSIIDNSGDWA